MTAVLYGNTIMSFANQAELDNYLGTGNYNKNSVSLNNVLFVIIVVFIMAGVLYMISTKEYLSIESCDPDNR
jgi:hypothetical protein